MNIPAFQGTSDISTVIVNRCAEEDRLHEFKTALPFPERRVPAKKTICSGARYGWYIYGHGPQFKFGTGCCNASAEALVRVLSTCLKLQGNRVRIPGWLWVYEPGFKCLSSTVC